VADHEHWQLDGSSAELYERYLVPAITSIWAIDLVDRVQPQPGQSILDIACGTGVVARMIGERIGVGRIVGLDLNAGMLAVARAAATTGAPIEWREGSALSLPFDDASFDLVLCQLGLQFFPNKSLALREMKRVMMTSGRVALSVYSAIERTPAAFAFVSALEKSLGPDASKIKRSEHIFPDANDVRTLLADQRPHCGETDHFSVCAGLCTVSIDRDADGKSFGRPKCAGARKRHQIDCGRYRIISRA
jgi:ubiquinone/menaquinone biosynthesis C-methylase UbiE